MSFEFSGAQTRVVTDRQVRLDATVVAIGAFDGVHRGHQKLIRDAVADARAQEVPAVVWTFDPPPKVFFGRAAQLSPLQDKLARIALLGPDLIVVASFNATYCKRPAESFLDDLARIAPRRIHVGADFRFGARQAGDIQRLARRFEVQCALPVRCSAGEVVSSTRIRAMHSAGDSDGAASLQACPGSAARLAGRQQMQDMRFQETQNV
ncbi:MAG: FAD synthetase [Planctomycetota bacterium]